MKDTNNFSDRLTSELITFNEASGKRVAEASILPGLGANLISFKVDGTEYIYWDEKTFLTESVYSGGFNMFPTPCRLAECSYTFEGQKIIQKKHGNNIFIHGLIRDEIMESVNEGDKITSRIEMTPKHPAFEGFPFKYNLSISHELINRSLKISFCIENRDKRNIPFGFGVHPYWRIHGERKDVKIKIPCDYIMDSQNLVPTGTYSPVDNTSFDLRSGKSLDALNLDKIYWKKKEEDRAEITFSALNRKIIITTGSEFTHMIAYTPPDNPYFCVENLTTSPNAPNLVNAGKGEAAHMLIVPPGEKIKDWIKYEIEA